MTAPVDSVPASATVHMQWGVRIPLRDGVHLSATLYLPRSHTTPSPAIFTLTPYVAQTYHDVGMYFAEHGYPFLAVDVRGRGNSEGTFQPFINEGRDGYDVVEWLAQQSYCNGKVAMWGGSYAGYDQWVTAREAPLHLATIAPVASPYFGVDFPMRNNIPQTYLTQWLMLVSGRTSQDAMFWNSELFWGGRFRLWFESGVPFRDLDSLLGNPSDIFQEWAVHPEQDSYWDKYNPSAEQYAQISIPVLTITGSCDDDQPGALTHYQKHLENATACENHYLVIGPWDHAGTRNPKSEFAGLKIGPEGVLDLKQLHLQWYDWTMRSGPRPLFLKKRVAYYVMGSEKWRYANTLEAVTSQTAAWFLGSAVNPIDVFTAGSLSREPPKGSQVDCYVYDPRETDHAALESTIDPENRVDHRLIYSRPGRHLVYHSLPFSQDTELSGFFKLTAWLSIDQSDTDFRASVYAVDLAGSAVLLTMDLLRARYSESLREAKLVLSAEPRRYDFERFTFVSRLMKKGSRLRLIVGPIDSIYWQKNYNSGGIVADESMADARPVTVRLFHDPAHPSALYVPMATADVAQQ